jgi:hypothetical protein
MYFFLNKKTPTNWLWVAITPWRSLTSIEFFHFSDSKSRSNNESKQITASI